MSATRAATATGKGLAKNGGHPPTGAAAPGEIDRIVSLFRQRLLSEEPLISKGFSFTVTGEEDGRLRLEPVAAPATLTPLPDLRTPGWDPYEAGRRIVEEFKAAEGGAWTGEDLGKEFQLTSATLHARRRDFRIVYWQDARGHFHYPKWQFNGAGVLLSGIQEVLQTFRSRDQWGVMSYFLSPRLQLDSRTPLALLRAGEPDKVLAHARTHAQENTW